MLAALMLQIWKKNCMNTKKKKTKRKNRLNFNNYWERENNHLPIEFLAPLKVMADRAPTRPPPAVSNWKTAACHLVKPDLSKMAKSPTSWGISCTKMAKVVKSPSRRETRNAPPNERPCVKLSIVLAARFR